MNVITIPNILFLTYKKNRYFWGDLENKIEQIITLLGHSIVTFHIDHIDVLGCNIPHTLINKTRGILFM